MPARPFLILALVATLGVGLALAYQLAFRAAPAADEAKRNALDAQLLNAFPEAASVPTTAPAGPDGELPTTRGRTTTLPAR